MHLLSLVFGFALLPAAFPLRCYECSSRGNETCVNSVRQCPLKGQQCGAVSLASQPGFPQANLHMKSCVTADQCLKGSINYGITRTVITSKCCSSDLCNTEFPPAGGGRSQPNGNKCYTCSGMMCTGILDCEGDEDYCMSSSMSFGDALAISMKGCASKQICTNLDQIVGTLGVDVSCCHGYLCNSASSPRVGLLLLLTTPLLTSVMLC